MSRSKKSKTKCQLEIEKALSKGVALSASQLSENTGYSYNGICKTLRGMRGTVYIASWHKVDEYNWARVYKVGQEPDAPKPVSKDPKPEVDQLDLQLALERERRAKKALSQPAFRHWMDAALFGEFSTQVA